MSHASLALHKKVWFRHETEEWLLGTVLAMNTEVTVECVGDEVGLVIAAAEANLFYTCTPRNGKGIPSLLPTMTCTNTMTRMTCIWRTLLV